MRNSSRQYVIVGSSHAGVALARGLRRQTNNDDIILIGEESVLPYQRPPLSKKYLFGEISGEQLLIRPSEFYNTLKIDFIKGIAVKNLLPAEKLVILSDGRKLHFDRLALCTGAQVKKIPANIGGNLGNVLTIRTLADAKKIRYHLIAGNNMVVVGGGYVGLEIAAAAIKMGMKVTLLEAASRILHKSSCEQVSQILKNIHHKHGVNILEKTKLIRLENSTGFTDFGNVKRIVLEDGSILQADVVVVGIGITPNVLLAKSAGLAVKDGIVVNSFCQTSDRDVFACGDCTSFPWHNSHIRLESLQNAHDQANVASSTMLGKEVFYNPVPWFWSDQYDVKLQIAGLNRGHNSIVERTTNQNVCSFWYYKDDTLISVDAINDARSYMIGKRFLELQLTPDPVDIADNKTDLKQLLKSASFGQK